MSDRDDRTPTSIVSHTEYVRGRFQCAGCGASVPAEKRAGGRLCVVCRTARADD
ncbi:MAG: hypothetical protein V5A31_07625 [Haloferacaceae archaeon]|jgi:hypothetical protein